MYGNPSAAPVGTESTLASIVWSPTSPPDGAALTVTVKLPELLFAAGSDAVQLTVVVPIGNVLPEGGMHVTVNADWASSGSVAETVKVTVAPEGDMAVVVMFAGNVSVGEVVSGGGAGFTVTVNDPDELLPAGSVAMHWTVVVPIGNVLPDEGLQVIVNAEAASSGSVAVTV